MTCGAPLAGIVLAGGLSTRMGQLKPLLEVDGVPVVVRSAHTFLDIGVEPVVVVGFAADHLTAVLDEAGIRHVLNEEYERGMYSSVVTGVKAVGTDTRWTAVLPADCPLVAAETVGQMLRDAIEHQAHVVYPIHRGRRGHPPLFGQAVREAILVGEPPGGLHDVLSAHDDRALEVPVEDPGVLIDMDDPEDYARVTEQARSARVPDPDECRRILERNRAPEAVREHGVAVARVAGALGRALNDVGACLNLWLLQAAALLHDVCRGEPDHPVAGAARLTAQGYARVAAVVMHHMDLPEPLAAIPGEAEVLYLADKLVRGIATIPLEQRLHDALERFAGDRQAAKAARRRLEGAVRVASVIESLVGQPLDRLIA